VDIFETASRKKFRFSSDVGELTTEQLWDLPLISAARTGPKVDLDTIARAVNTDLKAVTEESFVAVKPDPRKPDLEVKLEVVKHIIAFKIKTAEDAKARAERDEKRRKLIEALASKEEQALAGLSLEEIQKQLADLDA
jgi:hypothetical protein